MDKPKVKHARDFQKIEELLPNLQVVFALGGPGAGKGTQRSKIAELKHGMTSLLNRNVKIVWKRCCVDLRTFHNIHYVSQRASCKTFWGHLTYGTLKANF